MRDWIGWALPLLVGLLAACSGDDANDGGGGAGADFGNAQGGGGEPTTYGPGSSGTAGSAPGGSAAGGGTLDDDACRRVDLIIAVDGSESMTEELEAMRTTVFPAFAERLANLGGGLDDYRVATLDACPQPASYHSRGAERECDFSSGSPWIDSGSSAMADEFACVGDIYQDDHECSGDNDDEQPASAIAASLELPVVTAENLGFRRSDALLITIAITDEDEQPTGDADSAQDVYSRLVGVAGDPQRMVFLGIGGSRDCEGAYGDADEATQLRNITERFEANGRGVFWDLCEGRLEDGLERAFQVIERACEELPPPCTETDPDDDCWPGGEVPPTGRPLFCIDNPDDPGCQLD
jgi:hypothetical protein